MDAFDAVESAMIQFLAKRYKDGNYAVFWPEMVATLATVTDDRQLIARVQAHLAQRKLLSRGTINPPNSRSLLPWRRTGEEGYDCVPHPAIREVATAIGANHQPTILESRVETGATTPKVPPKPLYLDIVIDDQRRTIRRHDTETNPIPASLLWPMLKELVAAGGSGIKGDRWAVLVEAHGGEKSARGNVTTELRQYLGAVGLSIPDARRTGSIYRIEVSAEVSAKAETR
jgi:hypothetical protein